MEANQDKDYYVATKDEKGIDIIYSSGAYKLSEIDLINLIKICLVEERSKSIGRRLLEAYKDSTQHRAVETQKKLNQIGIKDNGNREPTKARNPKFK
jgi:hypothetical protein